MGPLLHYFWFLKYDRNELWRVLGGRKFVVSIARFLLTIFDLSIKSRYLSFTIIRYINEYIENL